MLYLFSSVVVLVLSFFLITPILLLLWMGMIYPKLHPNLGHPMLQYLFPKDEFCNNRKA